MLFFKFTSFFGMHIKDRNWAAFYQHWVTWLPEKSCNLAISKTTYYIWNWVDGVSLRRAFLLQRRWQWKAWLWTVSVAKTKHTSLFGVAYAITWKVMSVSFSVTEGDFTFWL